MHKKIGYRILNIGLRLGMELVIPAGIANAQQVPRNTPTQADLYCSGVVTDKPIPNDSRIISGENSRYKTTFSPPAYVFINRAGENGVKVGHELDAVRPTKDETATNALFKYHAMLPRAI